MKRISDRNKSIQRKDSTLSTWQQNSTYVENDVVYDSQYNHIVRRVSINPDEVTETAAPSTSVKWTVVNAVPVWAANVRYPSGFILEHSGVLYKCNSAHTSSVFSTDIANWTPITSSGSVTPWDMTPANPPIACVYPLDDTGTFFNTVMAGETAWKQALPANAPDYVEMFMSSVSSSYDYFSMPSSLENCIPLTTQVVAYEVDIVEAPDPLTVSFSGAFSLGANFTLLNSGGSRIRSITVAMLVNDSSNRLRISTETLDGLGYYYEDLATFPVGTPSGRIGVYFNPVTGKVGVIFAGTDYGYIAGLPAIVGAAYLVPGLKMQNVPSAVVGQPQRLHLYGNVTNMTSTYPTGTVDLCTNPVDVAPDINATLPVGATNGTMLEVVVAGSYGGESYAIGDIAIVKVDGTSTEKLSNVAGGGGTWLDTYTAFVGTGVGATYIDIVALNAYLIQNNISGRLLNVCFSGGSISANDAVIYLPQFREINIIAGDNPLDDADWPPINSPAESLTIINSGNQTINIAGVWNINNVYMDGVNIINGPSGGPGSTTEITFNGSSSFHDCSMMSGASIISTFENVYLYNPSGRWTTTGTYDVVVGGYVDCYGINTDGHIIFINAHGNCGDVYHTAYNPTYSPFVMVAEGSHMRIGTVEIGNNIVDQILNVDSAIAIVGNVLGAPNVSVFNQTPNIATINGMIYAAGDGSGNYPQVITYTTSRTSIHDDVGKYIRYDSATDVTYSIDQEGTLFPLSGEIHIEQVNTGKVTIDVALASDGQIVHETIFIPTTRGQHGVITIKKTVHGATRADDKFTVFGALEEAPV